ncbi:MAG: Apolipoprotein N-acyltransferase in lipid-linked oligosaccharide synthesis cluster [uncultured Friedmanniella sp.]|uniref:Apolipoprotein N-acyltransferase n=1 Tax=uncultured Friedmanniella sp. TaxID=335381 RepID=A0A6J4L0L3_9ACTN|nr:apolipoprotein N-acyltransferase [uncultured Friedmanniella sp.]CAA9318881.1 MAG: Apolipoprotein N-acyltransferase in lipid-linked oligosaccharide synthesis cluster [uncultured Friedmanniella sp.]
MSTPLTPAPAAEVVPTAPAAPASGRTGRAARLLPAVAAVAAGALLGLSWQPYGLWPLLLVGVPALTLLVRGLPHRRSFRLGYLFGLGLLSVTISWVHVLGVWVAALLIAFESLFFGLLAVGLTLVLRLPAWPLAAACCWVAVEFAYSRVPFDGFGWVRLAYAAVDTPVAGFFPLIGVAGVSFVVALVGQLVAWLVLRLRRRAPAAAGRVAERPPRGPLLVVAGALVLLVVLGTALRGFQVEPAAGRLGAVRVGIVQGNVPGRGIEALGRARSVTNNHLAQTVELMTKARLGQVPAPDFLLWPENSTDIDPTRDALTRLTVQSAAEVAGVPILVGAVTQGPGADERQTTALWWDPAAGVLARYDKRNLVPFGEWIPFRDQLLPLVPVLAQVGAQSVPGTTPGVLDVAVAGRNVKVGDVICFELAYDRTVYEALTEGAQVSLVQSNNATYGGTGQIEQQFAITRARAMESRREIAVATTNSVSGFIDRNGRVVTRTQEFTADDRVVTMPLRTSLTPAVRVASWLDRGVTLLAVLACGLALVAARSRRAHSAPVGPARAPTPTTERDPS